MAMLEQPAAFPAWQPLQDQWNAFIQALSIRVGELVHVLGAEDPASRRALIIVTAMVVLTIASSSPGCRGARGGARP